MENTENTETTAIAEETPKYEIIEFKGQPARLYHKDGSIRDEKGHVLKKPDYIMKYSITSELSKEYRSRRKELMLQAVEDGVIKATKAADPYAAMSRIIQRRAEVAMKDDGRAGNEAAKIVMEALDAYQDKKSENVNVQRNEYVIDEATQNMLLDIMSNRQEDVIDVQARHIEVTGVDLDGAKSSETKDE